jgi:hypothetical protein
VKHEKNGKFWNVSDIVALSEEEAESASNPPKRGGTKSSKSGGGKPNSSDSMSKAEWAEKDRITRLSIAKSASLKQAVANLKEGATANAVLKRAEEFLPYLLDLTEPATADDGTDPLDPPA